VRRGLIHQEAQATRLTGWDCGRYQSWPLAFPVTLSARRQVWGSLQ